MKIKKFKKVKNLRLLARVCKDFDLFLPQMYQENICSLEYPVIPFSGNNKK